jgi:tRNA (guanine6-N2)-methyltransferase
MAVRHGGRRASLAVPHRPPVHQGETVRRSRPGEAGAAVRLLVHCVPGLEAVVTEEIAARFPAAELAGAWRQFDERTSLLEFRAGDDWCAWRSLDTAEDVFLLVARARAMQTDRRGLNELGAAILGSKLLMAGLDHFARCWGQMPRTFRVVARKAGAHAYRRIDAQVAVERALGTRLPQLRSVEDDADAEFWLTVVGTTALLGLRLSSAAMRGPSYPFTTLPASLKPSVARAMVRLSRPRPDDRVLDPLCGAGTLLLERAASGPYAVLLGGDRASEAVAVATANAATAGVPISLDEWDALALPLPDRSIDAILSNPPFGKRVEIPGDGPYPFYRHLLRELRRVLAPGGRLVLLTSQTDALQRGLRGLTPPLVLSSRFPVLVRGERATIFVLGGE